MWIIHASPFGFWCRGERSQQPKLVNYSFKENLHFITPTIGCSCQIYWWATLNLWKICVHAKCFLHEFKSTKHGHKCLYRILKHIFIHIRDTSNIRASPPGTSLGSIFIIFMCIDKHQKNMHMDVYVCVTWYMNRILYYVYDITVRWNTPCNLLPLWYEDFSYC